MSLATTDDVVIVDSTTLLCTYCQTFIAIDAEADGELTALSVEEAHVIATTHIKERHR